MLTLCVSSGEGRSGGGPGDWEQHRHRGPDPRDQAHHHGHDLDDVRHHLCSEPRRQHSRITDRRGRSAIWQAFSYLLLNKMTQCLKQGASIKSAARLARHALPCSPTGNQEAISPAAWTQTGSRLLLCRISCDSGYSALCPDDSERRHHRDPRASSCRAPCTNAHYAPPMSAGCTDSRGVRAACKSCLCNANPLRGMYAIAHSSASMNKPFAANGMLTGARPQTTEPHGQVLPFCLLFPRDQTTDAGNRHATDCLFDVCLTGGSIDPDFCGVYMGDMALDHAEYARAATKNIANAYGCANGAMGQISRQFLKRLMALSASMWLLPNPLATRSSRAWRCASGSLSYAGTHAYRKLYSRQRRLA